MFSKLNGNFLSKFSTLVIFLLLSIFLCVSKISLESLKKLIKLSGSTDKRWLHSYN